MAVVAPAQLLSPGSWETVLAVTISIEYLQVNLQQHCNNGLYLSEFDDGFVKILPV